MSSVGSSKSKLQLQPDIMLTVCGLCGLGAASPGWAHLSLGCMGIEWAGSCLSRLVPPPLDHMGLKWTECYFCRQALRPLDSVGCTPLLLGQKTSSTSHAGLSQTESSLCTMQLCAASPRSGTTCLRPLWAWRGQMPHTMDWVGLGQSNHQLSYTEL